MQGGGREIKKPSPRKRGEGIKLRGTTLIFVRTEALTLLRRVTAPSVNPYRHQFSGLPLQRELHFHPYAGVLSAGDTPSLLAVEKATFLFHRVILYNFITAFSSWQEVLLGKKTFFLFF